MSIIDDMWMEVHSHQEHVNKSLKGVEFRLGFEQMRDFKDAIDNMTAVGVAKPEGSQFSFAGIPVVQSEKKYGMVIQKKREIG